MEKISAVYRITNTITNDFYIGSSKNVKERWMQHKCKSRWKKYSNSPLYLDFQKYGIDKFEFQVIEEVEAGSLRETEQQFIETLKPTYNNYNANGLNIEKYKESQRKYNKSEKGKESLRKAQNKYHNQLCCYNGETLTLCALCTRFKSKGLSNPTQEAKKYLIRNSNECMSNQ